MGTAKVEQRRQPSKASQVQLFECHDPTPLMRFQTIQVFKQIEDRGTKLK